MKQWLLTQRDAFRQDWRRLSLYTLIGIAVVLVVGQVLYPPNRLLPFLHIDGVAVGGETKAEAVTQLNDAYNQATMPIYFGVATKPYRSPHPADIGMTISNQSRVAQIAYPWYLRLVPTSIFWGTSFSVKRPSYHVDTTQLHAYITKELGSSCNVKPENSNLKVVSSALVVVPGQSGGTCDIGTVTSLLKQATPRPHVFNKVAIPVRVIPAVISEQDASALKDTLDTKLSPGIVVHGGSVTQRIVAKTLMSWLDFDNTGNTLQYHFDTDRASSYLTSTFGAAVATKPGITTVNTTDFVETSRDTGTSGTTLDVAGTLQNMKQFVDGASSSVVVATSAVPATIVYNRAYSPTNTGLSALMQQYASSHAGTFGVAMVELSGQHRNASYNGDQTFTTASTYKLFVAYSTLKRVEAGGWHWTDQIEGGKDLTTCFNDMIELSDNACAEALLTKVGQQAVTNDAHSLGCNNTSFVTGDNIISTPSDEALFLSELATGQMLNQQSSRDRFISALEGNVYRQGIPAGIPQATVADKVGFLWNLLHDAAIVYSPSGTYVLVIMTDGSTWGNIADLASKIEALRTQSS